MKIILTVGVFDLLHIGHIKLFQNSRNLGDKLIVAVQKQNYINIFKPGTQVYYSEADRVYMVKSIKYVDDVILYESVDKLLPNIPFDVFAVGEDQTNESFMKAKEWCKANNKQIVIVPRTKGISSSMLRIAQKS